MKRDKSELVAIGVAAVFTFLQVGLQVWMWFGGSLAWPEWP